MKAVVFAYNDVGYVGLKELINQRVKVLAVFTHEDDPRETIWFRSVAELARTHKLPVFTPEDVNTPEWIEKIRQLQPDIIFSFYFRHMICQEILDIPPQGALNLHGSLLPRYRGRAPVNWVLVKGETETGATLHYMTTKPDAGDIVAQKKVAIDFEDTALTLFGKITTAAEGLMHETLPLLRKGTAPRIPQDLSQGNYCRGRKAADGIIDWSQPALSIYNLIRAVTHPYPGAFTFCADKKLFVWEAHPVEGDPAGAPPGTVVRLDKEAGVSYIATGQGLLRLEWVQWKGGREAKGSTLRQGLVFGPESPHPEKR